VSVARTPSPVSAFSQSAEADRIARLEDELSGLKNEVADLKQQLAAFRKQFE
jgi:predicted  nucleic acid-binding Zn-ribbon protein